jgi:hypothetical protein
VRSMSFDFFKFNAAGEFSGSEEVGSSFFGARRGLAVSSLNPSRNDHGKKATTDNKPMNNNP